MTCLALQIIPWLSFSVPGIGHLTMLTALVLASLGCLLAAVVSDAGRCCVPCYQRAPLHEQSSCC